MPLVSVITPTYNRAKFLQQAIESVRAQMLTDWELIIIDDGSTDDTAQVVAREAVADHRIRYVRQQNQGLSAARNHGIKIARGEFVAFLDDDDWWLPHKLQVQTAFMRQHPEYAMSCGQAYLDGAKDTSRPIVPRRSTGGGFRELVQGNFIVVLTVMIRRSCLRAVGEFRGDMKGCQDFDLWLRVARRYLIGFIPQPLGSYRRHPGNMTDNLIPAYLEHITVLAGVEPDTRLGVDDRLKNRAIATYHYKTARLLLEQNRYREAGTHFLGAIRLDPMIGQVMRWSSEEGGRVLAVRRWFSPYLAVAYCWLRGVGHAHR